MLESSRWTSEMVGCVELVRREGQEVSSEKRQHVHGGGISEVKEERQSQTPVDKNRD